MSSLGTLVVSIAANLGRYKADLNDSATATTEATNKIGQSTGQAEAAVGRMGASMGHAAKDAEKLSNAIDQQISALRTQADTLGMDAAKVTLYKLALDGATDAQLKQAKSALESVEALRSGHELGEKIGNSIRNGALAAAAGAAVAYAAFESLIGNISKYQDLAEQTGGDPAGLASLRTAADVGGASVESLVMAANRLQRSLASTDEESKGVGRALAAIGISIKDFKELRADEQIRSVAQALNQYADGGGKVAVVQEILGRGAATLLPALKELGNETEASNRLTAEQIQLADDYKDAQARAKSEMMQFAERMAVTALPAITEFTKAVKDTIAELMGIGTAASELDKAGALKHFSGESMVFLAQFADVAYDAAQAVHFIWANLVQIKEIGAANLRLDFAGAVALGKAAEEQNAQILKGLGLADKVRARIDAMNAASSAGGPKVDAGDASNGQKQIDFRRKEAKAHHERISEATKGLNLYNDLMATSVKVSANYTEQQALLNAGLKGGTLSVDDYTKATQLLVAKQPYMVAAAKLAEEQVKKVAKADLDAAEAHNKYIASLVEGLDKMKATNLAQQESNDRLGLSKEAIAELDAAKLESQAVTLDLQAIKMLDKNLDEAQYNLYKAQAEELRKLAVLKREGAVKEAGIDAAKKVSEEWKRGWEATDQIARDAFVGWAENGTSMADAIGKSLKKALLSAIYEATIKPIAFALYTSVMGNAAGTAAGAAGSGLMGSVGNSLMGNAVASMLPASVTTFGNAALAGIQNMVGMTNTVAQASTAAANGIAAGAQITAGAEITGSAAANTGAMFAEAIPYIAAAAIIYKILQGPGFVSTATMGASQGTYDASGKLTGSQAIDTGQTAAQISAAQVRADLLASSYYKTAESLGVKSVAATFGFNSNTGEQGAHPNVDFRMTAGDKSYKSGEISATDTAGITLAASRAVMTALQASELPKYLSGVFDGLTASTATQAQINDAMTLAQSYKGLHDQLQALPFAQLQDMSYKTASALVAASGGMEAFGSKLQSYYTNFYSAEEQRAQTIKNINAELAGTGFDAATASRDQFRALVEAQDVSTESGRKTYATLMNVSSAFAGLTTSIAPLLEIVGKSASSALSALEKSVAAEKKIANLARDVAAEQVTAITSIFDALKSNVDALYGQVSSTAAMQAAQGNAFISQALATAQSTGYLPDSAALSDAISAARSGADSAVYASQQDADFARLVLAGKLSALKDISGEQLTESQKALAAAQKQIDALDGIAASAKLQLDAVNGLDASVLSVAAAVAKFEATVQALLAAKAGDAELKKPKAAALGEFAAGPSGGSYAVTAPTHGVNPLDPGRLTIEQIAAINSGYSQSASLPAWAIAQNAELAAKDKALAAMRASMPKFATGAAFTNGIYTRPTDFPLGQMGEATPEAVMPLVNIGGSLGVRAVGGGGGNTDRLEALVEALTAEVQRLQSIVQSGNGHAARSADTLEKVTEGGNAMRSEIMNKVTVA